MLLNGMGICLSKRKEKPKHSNLNICQITSTKDYFFENTIIKKEIDQIMVEKVYL
jgi:hypothetical protein